MADGGRFWESFRSWLAMGIAVLSLAVAGAALVLSYLESPLSDYLKPDLAYGESAFSYTSPGKPEARGWVLLIGNTGNAPAHDVTVRVGPIDKEIPLDIRIPHKVEHSDDFFRTVRLEVIPKNYVCILMAKALPAKNDIEVIELFTGDGDIPLAAGTQNSAKALANQLKVAFDQLQADDIHVEVKLLE